MKNLLLILFLLYAITTNGQYSKSGIVEVPNLKSTQIYNQSKEWFFTSFKSAKSVIDVDVINEKIMGKGIATISYNIKSGKSIVPVQNPIDIIISIDIKDGKYRYKVETPFEFINYDSSALERSDFVIDSAINSIPGNALLGKKYREEMKENAKIGIVERAKQIKEIINGLEKSLINHIKESSNNW
jgi:hypothetical protein